MAIARSPLQYRGVRAIAPPDLTITDRAPTSTDTAFLPGQLWLDKLNLGSYQFSGVSWIELGTGVVGDIATLTGGSGGAIAPVGANISLLGTANQITTVGTAGTITWSLPAAITAPGSLTTTTTLAAGTSFSAGTTVTAGTGITATTGNIVASTGNINSTLGSMSAATTVTAGTGITATTGNIVASTGNITSTLGSVSAATTVTAGTSITATLGDITATNGNIVRGTAGNKDVYTSVASTTTAGANSAGTVTLVGGTATVSTTAVTASSLIRLTRQGVGATGANPLGLLAVGTITASTSFVINAWSAADATALAATDVSSIFWEIVN